MVSYDYIAEATAPPPHDLHNHHLFISWTRFRDLLNWGVDQLGLEDQHVLFMTDDRDGYIGKMFERVGTA